MAEEKVPASESSTQHAAPSTQHRESDDEISLLDILIVLAKHKKLILGIPFLAGLIALGITFLMPNIYTATTKILPRNALGVLEGGARPGSS